MPQSLQTAFGRPLGDGVIQLLKNRHGQYEPLIAAHLSSDNPQTTINCSSISARLIHAKIRTRTLGGMRNSRAGQGRVCRQPRHSTDAFAFRCVTANKLRREYSGRAIGYGRRLSYFRISLFPAETLHPNRLTGAYALGDGRCHGTWATRKLPPEIGRTPNEEFARPSIQSKVLITSGWPLKSPSPEATPKIWRLPSSLIARLTRFAKRASCSSEGCWLPSGPPINLRSAVADQPLFLF